MDIKYKFIRDSLFRAPLLPCYSLAFITNEIRGDDMELCLWEFLWGLPGYTQKYFKSSFLLWIFMTDVKGKPGKVKRQNKCLNRVERSDTYLIHVCRLPWRVERLERIDKKPKCSPTLWLFISCRSILTVTLAGATGG